MKKIILSSALIAVVLTGCGGDSSCCDSAIETKAAAIAPVAKITNLNNGTVIQAGETLKAFGTSSSDRDGNVATYQWSIDGKNISNASDPVVTLNDPGDHEVCLTVIDNDGLKSQNVECRTITVQKVATLSTPAVPTAVINLDNALPLTYLKDYTLSCLDSHDNDNLGTGNDIVSCDWDIQSYRVTNGNEVPYRDCSAANTMEHPIHICKGAAREVSRIVVKLTVTDNDGQTHTTSKEYTKFEN